MKRKTEGEREGDNEIFAFPFALTENFHAQPVEFFFLLLYVPPKKEQKSFMNKFA